MYEFLEGAKQFNFRPDSVFKYLFTHLSTETRINLLNSIFGITIPNDTRIEVLNTENTVSNDVTNNLENSRADLLFDVGLKRRLHIEFQSTYDKNMGTRIFLYGYHAAKESSLESNIIHFPYSHVLYTILNKEKHGKDYLILNLPNCSIGDIWYSECNITVDVHYTNLLAFTFDDFKKDGLEVLSFISLYRFLKDKRKCTTENGKRYF